MDDLGSADEPDSPGGFEIDSAAEARARAQEAAAAVTLDERMGQAQAAREAHEAAAAAVPHAPLHSGTPPAAKGVQWAAAERVLLGDEHAGTEGTAGEWVTNYDETL